VHTRPKTNQYKIPEAARPILTRTAAFLACFVIASGIIGSHLIGHGLVHRYGFEIYGEAGKGVLFGLLALLLLIRHKGAPPRLRAWKLINIWWLIGAVFSGVLSWPIIDKLLIPHPSIIWPIAANVSILTTVILLLLFSFSLVSVHIILKTYIHEILLSIGLVILFEVFLYFLYMLWPAMSAIVINSDRAILDAIGIHTVYIKPRTLLFSNFGITVGDLCSGIDSIGLFTALYALVGILDWRRFNHKKYLAVFIPALLVLFGFNILRVLVLMLGGYYINPQITFSLFHTYAGMVFFIIYSVIFWGINYKWMLTKKQTSA
jgi:exosortase/archaeosortase family protein